MNISHAEISSSDFTNYYCVHIKANELSNLIKQWSYDYEVEKEYSPEVLKSNTHFEQNTK